MSVDQSILHYQYQEQYDTAVDSGRGLILVYKETTNMESAILLDSAQNECTCML